MQNLTGDTMTNRDIPTRFEDAIRLYDEANDLIVSIGDDDPSDQANRRFIAQFCNKCICGDPGRYILTVNLLPHVRDLRQRPGFDLRWRFVSLCKHRRL